MRSARHIRSIHFIAFAIVAALYAALRLIPAQQPHPGLSAPQNAVVQRVIDGDTLKLADGRKVRLIGVDTPELHYSEKLLRDSARTKYDIKVIQGFGRRAADFTKELCEGRAVRLDSDVTKKDRYGRILAYAYLEDGTFVNAKILEEGYGQVMTIPPNVKHADYFLKIERNAREEHKGLWADTDKL